MLQSKRFTASLKSWWCDVVEKTGKPIPPQE
jgi:hypothetical protein